MSGVGRERVKEDGSPDFERMFQSLLARGCSRAPYAIQVCGMMTGNFLVFDPEGSIDPALPPELKSTFMAGKAKPLTRGANAVPEETLKAIQACFLAPAQHDHPNYGEIEKQYAKAAQLCRKAIADHANAPDLWIVRNRLMIAHFALWKITGDLGEFEAAIAQAQAAIEAGYPKGCDLIAHFCLARAALRESGDKSCEVIDQFVADQGGESATGPALAAACILALDVADRVRFEKLRGIILSQHAEHPMMWVFTSFLLDRHHRYWLFQFPFTAGWSYGRREGYFKDLGFADEGTRMLKGELVDGQGKAFRIPEDIAKNYTIILFSPAPPWGSKRDDGLPPSPMRALGNLNQFAASRPDGDVQVALAVLGDKAHPGTSKDRKGNDVEIPSTMLALPGGVDNPLVHRLGIFDSRGHYGVVLDKQGRMLAVISDVGHGGVFNNVVQRQDELRIEAMLEKGEIEAAKKKVLALVPPFDPEAVDDRGRKLRQPKYTASQLSARAKVYMALGEMDKALADAEQVYLITFSQAGSLSMRTEELDEAEALRDRIKAQMQK